MNNKLVYILKCAEKNSEYYHNLFQKCGIIVNDHMEININKIPVLTRTNIVNARDQILHMNYRYVNRKNLICERTSGSTGQLVEVYWKLNEYVASNRCLWKKRKEWYGISATDKKCTFYTVNYSNEKIILKKNIMEFSSHFLSEEDLKKYYEQMQIFEPKWLMVTPSIAMILYQYCYKRGLLLPSSIKYIELFGEDVSTSVYNLISGYFKIPTSIMYGAREVNGIGLTCPNGRMHILDDNVFVEQGEDNKILVTSLCNTVFPVIRYDIGDIIILDKSKCICSGSEKGISKINGKNHYLSYLNKKMGVTSGVIKNILTHVDEMFGFPFLQMQVEFMGEKLYIHIYCKEEYLGWKKEINDEIMKQIGGITLSDLFVQIIFHNKPIPINIHTGKLPFLQGEEIDL